MPNETEENWQYGRIDALDLDDFPPVEAPAGQLQPDSGQATQAMLSAIGSRAGLARSVDGVIASLALSEEVARLGVKLVRLSDLAASPEGFGDVLASRADGFTFFADAFGFDAVVCIVPAGVRVDEPICIMHEISSASSGRSVFPRTFFHLGEGATATVVEFIAGDDDSVLVIPIVELDVGTGAHLAHNAIQQLGRRSWQLGYQTSRVGKDGELRSFIGAFGGDYARQMTEVTLAAPGATSAVHAVYLSDGSSVQDIRTFQEHAAPHTTSDLMFKGAVADTARSVYTGLIHIQKGACRSIASQTNRNLVLSEGAHADSVPNLDIEENDVRCSHASAVGPIDPEQRFYLESCGIPPEIADRLILLGFFGDVLDRITQQGCATYLRALVAERLASRFARGELDGAR